MSKVQLTPEQLAEKELKLKKIKAIVDTAVSIGAAVVIIGALFKILHWKGANELLIVGMFTEAAIFLIYAILPADEHGGGTKIADGGTTKLDSTQLVTALNEVKDAIVITNGNLDTIKASTENLKALNHQFVEMSNNLKQLSDFTENAQKLANAMSESVEDANKTKTELNALATNLGKLNGIYQNMFIAMQGSK
jgi:hypothetical protein